MPTIEVIIQMTTLAIPYATTAEATSSEAMMIRAPSRLEASGFTARGSAR